MTQYSNSKLYNVLFTQGLNNLINKNGLKHVKTASLHPGIVETNFGNETCWARFFRCLCCCAVVNQNEGSRTSMYLCNAPLADIRSG
jgi:short-subunit dehydrogenase